MHRAAESKGAMNTHIKCLHIVGHKLGQPVPNAGGSQIRSSQCHLGDQGGLHKESGL